MLLVMLLLVVVVQLLWILLLLMCVIGVVLGWTAMLLHTLTQHHTFSIRMNSLNLVFFKLNRLMLKLLIMMILLKLIMLLMLLKKLLLMLINLLLIYKLLLLLLTPLLSIQLLVLGELLSFEYPGSDGRVPGVHVGLPRHSHGLVPEAKNLVGRGLLVGSTLFRYLPLLVHHLL
jgi:hypothetical protein